MKAREYIALICHSKPRQFSCIASSLCCKAHKNLEHSAIADAEYALALAQYAKDDFPILYLVGFLCEVHIFTDKISKAKFYYNLGLQLLDKNSADYDNDKASFDRLQDLMNGEDWKE